MASVARAFTTLFWHIPKRVILTVVVLGGLLLIIYLGVTIYGNIATGEIKIPSAEYEIYIHSNGNILYADEVIQDGSSYVLPGYYELIGRRFKYRDAELSLNESIFGPIEVRRR